MTRSNAAVQANQTRQAREDFCARYSKDTLRKLAFIRRVDEGRRIPDSMQAISLEAGSVAAVRANLTRGTYSPWVTSGKNNQVVVESRLNLLTVR